jgi:O-antigen ligase
LALLIAIPALQLVALPPVLWTALPGRAAVVESYRAAGFDLPALGLSIAPWATIRSAMCLLAPILLFVGFLALDAKSRRLLWLLPLAVGFGSVLLEIVQIVEGADSPLRFYAPTDAKAGVGLFANRNHAAAFLYCLAPMAGAIYAGRRRAPSALQFMAVMGFFAALLIGLMLTGSCSALLLGGVSFVLTFLFVIRLRPPRLARFGRGRLGLAVVLIPGLVVALALAFGLTDILDRFHGEDVGPGDRQTLARVSFEAFKAFFPFGSGLGSFSRVYPLFQTPPTIAPAIVNHAHDDFLEIAIETGVLGLMAGLATVGAIAFQARRALAERDPARAAESRAAIIVIVLLLCHSLVDYPLRMPALAALFAICCATLFAARDASGSVQR